MGRTSKPIATTLPALAELAQRLRALRESTGLTFDQLAKTSGQVSSATLKRAASGNTIPEAKTITEFVTACGAGHDVLVLMLALRVEARIQERGVLKTLRPPRIDLIGDRRDLSIALQYVYEAAGAPSYREIRDQSGDPFALSVSTVGRIVTRQSLPFDERQLLAFLHGCGAFDHDAAWHKAWEKVSRAVDITMPEARPDSRVASETQYPVAVGPRATPAVPAYATSRPSRMARLNRQLAELSRPKPRDTGISTVGKCAAVVAAGMAAVPIAMAAATASPVGVLVPVALGAAALASTKSSARVVTATEPWAITLLQVRTGR
ncbi:helix-turn-helix domain-containing protein [Streptomyces xanthophaeus]